MTHKSEGNKNKVGKSELQMLLNYSKPVISLRQLFNFLEE